MSVRPDEMPSRAVVRRPLIYLFAFLSETGHKYPILPFSFLQNTKNKSVKSNRITFNHVLWNNNSGIYTT